jgi:hypothetical protein
MGLIVQTARVSYGGSDRLDITRKSGGPEGVVFAPSWAILRPTLDARERWKREGTPACNHTVESGGLWYAYEKAFLAEMRDSYRLNRGTWDALLARGRVVLCCYCADPNQCHRRILAGTVLAKLGATDAGEVS